MGFYRYSVKFCKSVVLICLSVHKLKFELFWGGFMCANTVKPRVSGHLFPSKKCPDTRECPISYGLVFLKNSSTQLVQHESIGRE